jgi:hypothetical protein
MNLKHATNMVEGFIIRGDSAVSRLDYESASHFYDAALAIVETLQGRRNLAVLDPLLRLVRVNRQRGLEELNAQLIARAQSITLAHAQGPNCDSLH